IVYLSELNSTCGAIIRKYLLLGEHQSTSNQHRARPQRAIQSSTPLSVLASTYLNNWAPSYSSMLCLRLIPVCWAADVHMSDESNKYKLLRQAAKRATQKQPDEIHLIPAPNHRWTNPAAIKP